jgi:hypothetical protein
MTRACGGARRGPPRWDPLRVALPTLGPHYHTRSSKGASQTPVDTKRCPFLGRAIPAAMHAARTTTLERTGALPPLRHSKAPSTAPPPAPVRVQPSTTDPCQVHPARQAREKVRARMNSVRHVPRLCLPAQHAPAPLMPVPRLSGSARSYGPTEVGHPCPHKPDIDVILHGKRNFEDAVLGAHSIPGPNYSA